MFDDFPMREQELDLVGVGKFQRAEKKARGFERRCHGVPKCVGAQHAAPHLGNIDPV
jgi:hypothetical protein